MKDKTCNKKLLLHGKCIMFFLIGAIILVACSNKKDNKAIADRYSNNVEKDSLSEINRAKRMSREVSPEAEEWKKRGNAAFDSANYDKAIEYYLKAIDVDSNYYDAYHNLGLLYYQILEFDKSIEYYSRAITKDNTEESAFFALGNAYVEINDFGKALEMYKAGVKLKPDIPEAHHYLGLLYGFNNNHVYSKAHITRAAQLGDSSAREFFNGDSLLWKDTFMRPDYKQIKLNVENKQSNLYYPKLWDRFQKGDTTMTKDELHHLYYGYVFDEDYSPFFSVHNPKQMKDILDKENPTKEEWAGLASSFDESLKAEPFNCLYLYYQSVAYDAINKPDESKKNHGKIKCILHAQAYSGDGLLKQTAVHLIAAPAMPHDFDYLFFKDLSLRNVSFEEGHHNVLYVEPNEEGLEEIWIDLSQPFNFMEQFHKNKRNE